jgi:hypothetical protein
VSGSLRARVIPDVPAQCGALEDWGDNVVLLDELNLGGATYNAGDGDQLVFGTNGPDNIRGGNGDDCIVARGGNDTVFAIFGFDYVFGGEGNDLLVGDGSSFLDGGTGDDTCFPLASSINCQQGDVFALTAEGHHSVPTIALTWTQIPQAVSYKVHRAAAAQGPFVQIGQATTPGYSDVGVLEDRDYYYSVTAVFAPGVESDPSAVRSARVPSLAPTATPTAASPLPSPTPLATATTIPSAAATSSASTPTPALSTPTPAPTRTPAATPTTAVQPTATPMAVQPAAGN